MSGLPLSRPETMGIDAPRLQRAWDLLQTWIDADKVPAAGVCVGRKGFMVEPRLLGRQRPEGTAPLRQDALFLVASVTKPVTVTAVMMLVERGLLTLEDKVAAIVPRFAARDKADIEVRHLMTHTSGLPDMLADNDKLRAAHKPFSAFVDAVCREPLLFPPGTRVNYQSMGTALLGEIVHQLSGKTLPEFLRQEVFEPLGMTDTSLGWDPAKKERIAAVRIKPEAQKTDWHWNSPYWLGFGAPWGGMITSPADMARFCQMMLNGGKLGDVCILSPATVRTMTCNQLAAHAAGAGGGAPLPALGTGLAAALARTLQQLRRPAGAAYLRPPRRHRHAGLDRPGRRGIPRAVHHPAARTRGPLPEPARQCCCSGLGVTKD